MHGLVTLETCSKACAADDSCAFIDFAGWDGYEHAYYAGGWEKKGKQRCNGMKTHCVCFLVPACTRTQATPFYGVYQKDTEKCDDDGWMDGAWHAVSHDTLSGGIETISVPSDDEAFGGAYGVLGGKLVKITTAEDSAQPFWKSVKTRYHSKQSE